MVVPPAHAATTATSIGYPHRAIIVNAPLEKCPLFSMASTFESTFGAVLARIRGSRFEGDRHHADLDVPGYLLHDSALDLARPLSSGDSTMNLVERAKRILLSPRTEWQVIDAEPTSAAQLYTRYVMPLAAIGPISQLIGYSVFGITVPFMGTYRVPLGSAFASAFVSYILALAATYVLALIIDGLASTFNAQRSQIQALKVSAYSNTASWVAGIFLLIPGVRVLTILGLYGLYLLYLGLPILMKSPREKTAAYTGLVAVAAIVLFLLVGLLAGRFLNVPTAAITVP
jgi:hypothetical protein